MNLSGQKKMNLKKYEIRWLKGNEFEEHIIKKDMLNISNHDDYQQLLWFSRRTETKIMSVGTIDMVVLKNCWNIDSISQNHIDQLVHSDILVLFADP